MEEAKDTPSEAIASDLALNQPLRHDIRGHLNDIYIITQTLMSVHNADPDTLEMLKSQEKSIELIQELLDLTIDKTDKQEPA